MIPSLRSAFRRVLFDEDGQDLVEYALLAAIVGLAGLGVFAVIRTNMADAYANWQDPAVPGSLQYNWEVPPPIE